MIYFIQQGRDGEIKIGVTSSDNIKGRLKSLQTSSPKKLYVLATMEGDASGEAQLHEKFLGCRLKGEWFAPTKTLLSFLETIKVPAPKTETAQEIVDWFKGLDDDRSAELSQIISEWVPESRSHSDPSIVRWCLNTGRSEFVRTHTPTLLRIEARIIRAK